MKLFSLRYGKAVAACALAVFLAVGVAAPAKADPHHDRDWNRRQAHWHQHEVAARHYHVVHPHPVYAAPVVYAPPVVVAPPPSGINFVIPLNIH